MQETANLNACELHVPFDTYFKKDYPTELVFDLDPADGMDFHVVLEIYVDALDRLGRDYDGIISEWKTITRELQADIVVLENETLFDSRKFRTMGDFGKVMEDHRKP